MKKMLFALCAVFCATSCNDAIRTQPESIITVNSFWKTEEDAAGGLYGMYNQFRIFAGSSLILHGEARSEVMGHALVSATNRIKYFENSLSAADADLNWQQLYRVVNYANLIIRYVPDISFTREENKHRIIAEALTMRAYVYFILTRTWGAVPLVTEPIEGYDAETIFKVRDSQSSIFAFIKADIDRAEGLFADNTFSPRRSSWSKPALKVLKADVYLWTGKVLKGGTTEISVALQALNEAENPDVTLLDNFGSIFDYNNKGNREVLFAVHYNSLEGGSNYFADMYVLPTQLPPGVDAATRAGIGVTGGNNYWAPTALVRNEFSADDRRRNASFLEIYTSDGGTPAYLTSIVLKGKGVVESGVRRFLNDIIIYRYADILLLKAEAKNALGQDPSVEINQIRRRAYGDKFPAHEFVRGTQVENDEALLRERLLEFIFEGKRWWDLLRFDKAFEKVPTLRGRESEKHLLLWPITLQTMSLDPAIKQNEGY